MPSGKPRRHRTNPGGRPSNKERLEELNGQIVTLRQLLYHRKMKDETWHLLHRILCLVNELDDLATPQRAATWEGTGHPAEPPILPGVQVTERGIVHAGTYAADLNTWFHRQVRWTIATTENRMRGKETDPKPRVPSRPTEGAVSEPPSSNVSA